MCQYILDPATWCKTILSIKEYHQRLWSLSALLLLCCNCALRASKQWLISLSHSQSGEQCVTWNHFRELDNWQQPSVIDQKGDWDLALFKMCILAFSHPCFVSQDYSDLQKSMSTQIRLKYNTCNIVRTCTDVWDKSRVRWQLIKAAANPRLLAAKLAHLIPLVAKLIKLDVRFIKFLQINFYLQHFDKPCLIFLMPFCLFIPS